MSTFWIDTGYFRCLIILWWKHMQNCTYCFGFVASSWNPVRSTHTIADNLSLVFGVKKLHLNILYCIFDMQMGYAILKSNLRTESYILCTRNQDEIKILHPLFIFFETTVKVAFILTLLEDSPPNYFIYWHICPLDTVISRGKADKVYPL